MTTYSHHPTKIISFPYHPRSVMQMIFRPPNEPISMCHLIVKINPKNTQIYFGVTTNKGNIVIYCTYINSIYCFDPLLRPILKLTV